jgi:hypothetical protein
MQKGERATFFLACENLGEIEADVSAEAMGGNFPLARLFIHPRHGNFEPIGELFRGEQL